MELVSLIGWIPHLISVGFMFWVASYCRKSYPNQATKNMMAGAILMLITFFSSLGLQLYLMRDYGSEFSNISYFYTANSIVSTIAHILYALGIYKLVSEYLTVKNYNNPFDEKGSMGNMIERF